MNTLLRPNLAAIKPGAALVLSGWLLLMLQLPGQAERRSLIDTDPEVVYLQEVFDKPLELEVVKEAPIFSDKEGQRRLSTLKVGQKVEVVGITERAYRVRGQGQTHKVVGWVGPWAFKHETPEFVDQMKQLYARQMQVKQLIDAGQIAIGMNLKEIGQVLGKPTKTQVRQTPNGQSGSWEFIEYEEVRHYATHIDPYSGLQYRTLVSVTQEVKERTVVEFENGYVTAFEESEQRLARRTHVNVVLPPLVCGW